MNMKRSVWERLPSPLTVVRAVSLCVFLIATFTVSVSVISLTALAVLLVSIYGVNNSGSETKSKVPDNPLKGKPRLTSLSEGREREVGLKVSEFVTNYDPENCTTLDAFQPIKESSECIFARRAKVWGAGEWDSTLSLEENVFRSVPMFLKFTLVCQELGLDGFLFMLPGQQFGTDPQAFGKGARRILQVLSDLDPAGFKCMDKSYIDKRGWVFEFNRVTFFVTTFAPFYPPTNSRYSYGAEDCFILLQPEISFAQQDLPLDTPETNWAQPKTVRDRIRTAFRDAGREYLIRDTVHYPMVYDIVKPLKDGDPLVEWWAKDK
ncbi:uncharacterized protein [Littorina saxatilis]|uniref:uncharacterized protein n=1 Tax=Littorina saxatilis TaxID=31220 RepID=UPI0038B49F16